MPHFDSNLAPYCLPGVGCHKDKSGHNSDVRQEHPGQLKLAGEKAKNKEGIFLGSTFVQDHLPYFQSKKLGVINASPTGVIDDIAKKCDCIICQLFAV